MLTEAPNPAEALLAAVTLWVRAAVSRPTEASSPNASPEPWLTTAEGARHASVSEETLREWIRKVYGKLHTFFADLVVDEVIPATPCALTKDQLPKLRDKNPEWRATALFSREEVELLLATEAIPEDGRVMNAILFLTGVRFGELAGLRWRDLDDTVKPLWRMTVARSYEHGTKTEMPRTVPVHPMLAEVLTAWKTEGFERLDGPRPGA